MGETEIETTIRLNREYDREAATFRWALGLVALILLTGLFAVGYQLTIQHWAPPATEARR